MLVLGAGVYNLINSVSLPLPLHPTNFTECHEYLWKGCLRWLYFIAKML